MDREEEEAVCDRSDGGISGRGKNKEAGQVRMWIVPLHSLGLQPRSNQVVKGMCGPAFGRGDAEGFQAHLGAT